MTKALGLNVFRLAIYMAKNLNLVNPVKNPQLPVDNLKIIKKKL